MKRDSGVTAMTRIGVCHKCGGRTFPDDDGDRACLQCGQRIYRLPPIALTDAEEKRRQRPPKHDDHRKSARSHAEQMRLVEV